MLERGSRYTLGVPLPETGRSSRALPGFQASSPLDKTYIGGRDCRRAGGGYPLPPVDFPENEADKLLKTKENGAKKRPKRS
jgi:hypothetical protein